MFNKIKVMFHLQLFTDVFEDKWDIYLHVKDSNGNIRKPDIDFEIENFILSIGGRDPGFYLLLSSIFDML